MGFEGELLLVPVDGLLTLFRDEGEVEASLIS